MAVLTAARPAGLLAAAALLAAPAAGAGVFFPKQFVLENGLRVVAIENRRAPVVVQMLWYRAGAADERPGEAGVAHFLEHLMFRGTKTTAPGAFARAVARLGGDQGAFTGPDFAAYHQTVASRHLEAVMRLEADRMRNLVIDDAVARIERDVVHEERRSRIDNRPASLLRERMRRALYLNHPYGRPTIGWESDVLALTAARARAFYERAYVPANAMLVVAGDVAAEEVLALARKHYGPIPRRPPPPRVRPEEPPHLAARRVSMAHARVRVATLSRIYLAPAWRAGGGPAAALEVLAELLGGGPTSRLHRGLVAARGVAAAAGAWYQGGKLDHGEFGVHATPAAGVDLDVLEAALDEELAAALADGFDAGDVARARGLIASAAVYARDGLRAGPSAIGGAFARGRTPDDVEAWPERIAAVAPGDVLAAARAVLDLRRSVTGRLLPEAPE